MHAVHSLLTLSMEVTEMGAASLMDTGGGSGVLVAIRGTKGGVWWRSSDHSTSLQVSEQRVR